MNQEQDNKLQQAINEVTQKNVNTENEQSDPIVPQRTMTSDDASSTNDDAVAAAMASVLPDSAKSTTPPTITPSISTTSPSPSVTPSPSITPSPAPVVSPDMVQVKEQALRELVPLLANLQINPEQKFKLYRDMIETLHDNSVAVLALDAAKQITDESVRAEALLYLVNLIDEIETK